MEKQLADQAMEEYFHKIYGYAVKKTYSLEEAEELCAEMIKEVYLSFLRSKELINVEGYVWRICENTFAKYVTSKKKKQGISLDGIILPYYDEYDLGESEEELRNLRREVAFLTQKRRQIVYSFYYLEKSILQIAEEMGISEGTVKWHLNKARNDLKEGFGMERKIGKLGLSPVEAIDIGHDGSGGPEKILKERLNLNIVYSVYEMPRTLDEIAEELGMTPVFLEDKIATLEGQGFIVKTSGNRYTTYVKFSPRKISLEKGVNIIQVKAKIAEDLLNNYISKIRETIANYQDIYIPYGNRELFEAAVIFYAIDEKCGISIQRDLEKYRIRTPEGCDFIPYVVLKPEIEDPEFISTLPEANKDYACCGSMNRGSMKYPSVYSWAVDSRFCDRTGFWENNHTTDYEALYEVMTGAITDNASNADKFNRLRKRRFLTEDGKINIMIIKEESSKFLSRIPELDRSIKDQYAGYALEQAIQISKMYPPQMQDLVVYQFVRNFIGSQVAMMVMDKLYDNGTFKPLTEQERVSSQLLMFCDMLPV